MPIQESQLQTWSSIGSVTQSKNTYATVKGVLGSANSPYYKRTFESFLQGSYGNDTNIFADSDVDVVLRLDSTFQFDIEQLPDASKASFHTTFPHEPYGYAEFKAEVGSWLTANYGTSVHVGDKAIRIDGNGSRRDADVLPCMLYRTYHKFNSASDQSHTEGITFYLPNGTQVVNYPKQHSANLTHKHQNTHNLLKPTVRILKNLRNRMVGEGVIEKGLAPSYFIEGMMSNVPSGQFNFMSYQQTIVHSLHWLANSDQANLRCANGIHWLVRKGYVECWDTDDFTDYLGKTLDYWNSW